MLKQISQILTKRDKMHLIFLFLIIIVSAFLDLIGISMVLPVVSLLSSGDQAIDQNFMLKLLSSIFNTRDVNTLATLSLLTIIIFYVFRTGYAFFHTYATRRFALNFSRKTTKKLIEIYLSYPYEFHLNYNSANLIRKCTYDADNFTIAIKSLINFVSTLITTLVIIIYLLITNYLITLIVGFFLGIFAVFVGFVLKPKVKKIAKKNQIYKSDNLKYLSQAFNGIKESKISNTENFFSSAYDKNRGKMNKLSLKKSMYDAFPKNCIELVGMLGICISLIIIILSNSESMLSIVETFTVFVYAVIKLLPLVSSITLTLNDLNFYKVSVSTLYEDIITNKQKSEFDNSVTYPPLHFDKKITLEDVTFYYEQNPNKVILNKVNLEIKKNTSVAFSGASGAGKTTVIDVILGLLPCRNGKVKCDETDISTNLRGWRNNISYVPQNIYLSDDTIKNNIAFGIAPSKIDVEKIWSAIKKAQLEDYVNSLPDGIDTVIGERGVRMSGGQRQRIGIARAFYRDTNIIVLDEATSALDYETEKNILEHVSQYSKDHTLIIITHRLNTIENCDNIFRVEDGKIKTIK